MKCVICKHGMTQEGKATVTLQRGGTTIIVRDVPAEVCENCKEYYLSESVTEKLFARAEVAVKNGTEVEIFRFAA